MVLDNLLNLGLKFWCHSTSRDLLEEGRLSGREVFTELCLPFRNILNRNIIEKTIDTSIDDGDLNLDGQRLVLTLFYSTNQIHMGQKTKMQLNTY